MSFRIFKKNETAINGTEIDYTIDIDKSARLAVDCVKFEENIIFFSSRIKIQLE